MPLPISTPTRVRSSSSMSSSACLIASWVAAIANWLKRAMRRASRRSMCSSGSKFLTSPAMWMG